MRGEELHGPLVALLGRRHRPDRRRRPEHAGEVPHPLLALALLLPHVLPQQRARRGERPAPPPGSGAGHALSLPGALGHWWWCWCLGARSLLLALGCVGARPAGHPAIIAAGLGRVLVWLCVQVSKGAREIRGSFLWEEGERRAGARDGGLRLRPHGH